MKTSNKKASRSRGIEVTTIAFLNAFCRSDLTREEIDLIQSIFDTLEKGDPHKAWVRYLLRSHPRSAWLVPSASYMRYAKRLSNRRSKTLRVKSLFVYPS